MHKGPRINSSHVSYGYQYSIGLFSYAKQPGPKRVPVAFAEANHRAGGKVAQRSGFNVDGLDEAGVERLRRRAEELDMLPGARARSPRALFAISCTE